MSVQAPVLPGGVAVRTDQWVSTFVISPPVSSGGVEEASAQEAQAVFQTNAFGLLNVTRAVLPYMRQQRRGHVINMSSVGGYASSPGWGVYCATKFAVEASAIKRAMRGNRPAATDAACPDGEVVFVSPRGRCRASVHSTIWLLMGCSPGCHRFVRRSMPSRRLD
jgi:hypothetical protein